MYTSDLTDTQWERIRPLLTGYRTYKWSKRILINAVLYVNRTGCQWRNLPKDFPPYKTVYSFYRRACQKSLWDKILQSLVEETRVKAGRNPSPTYAIVDSQSVKTVYGSQFRGIDGGKKIKGRKRHIVVDVMGNLLSVFVFAANYHDTTVGAIPALAAHNVYPTIEKFCGDSGYRNTFEANIFSTLGLEVDISKKIKPHDWQVLPKRWVVERTFGWMIHSRRLSKDYEIKMYTAECMVKISHIHTLLRRLYKL